MKSLGAKWKPLREITHFTTNEHRETSSRHWATRGEDPTLAHFRHFSSLFTNFSSTTVVSALQIAHFMQNKPNFQKAQMNVSRVSTRDYAKKTLGERGKNKPNSNPIQTQSNPIKANKMPKQTQNKAKQTQSNPNKPNFTPIASTPASTFLLTMGGRADKIMSCNLINRKYHFERAW
ncbi:MAG TPA: hypothetical protein HPP66_04910 [Planctomycetes bacterium]|nr:hypothetical protein [Planctomycetota bacterium]